MMSRVLVAVSGDRRALPWSCACRAWLRGVTGGGNWTEPKDTTCVGCLGILCVEDLSLARAVVPELSATDPLAPANVCLLPPKRPCVSPPMLGRHAAYRMTVLIDTRQKEEPRRNTRRGRHCCARVHTTGMTVHCRVITPHPKPGLAEDSLGVQTVPGAAD